MKMRGQKDLQKQLKKIRDKAKKELDGAVPLEELFSKGFLKKHSKFNDVEAMLNSFPVKIETQEDFENVDEEKLNPLIKENTDFENWDDFAQAAANNYAEKKLDNLFK